ncbi:hypothetical protein CRENBAI_015407 [Crenichthys baileyi]|uniref:Uncharacterized protein n=1 Tax=Crenichthys baileyi TaxID=28760 RepID=A0AAV9SI53_9TELE
MACQTFKTVKLTALGVLVLRFYARQIKSFRRTSLLYSSPELMEKIRQMEEDNQTAIRQFYCCPPPSSPSLQSGAAAAQPMPCFQSAATEQPTSGVQSAAAVQPTSGLQSAAAAPAHATEGLGEASAPAHATEDLGDASAPHSTHATEGLGNTSAPVHTTEGLGDAPASAPGLKAFQGFSKRLVLVLVPGV